MAERGCGEAPRVTAADEFGLTFGTGGIRAPMGDGPRRLNVGTVAVATQGLAGWLLEGSGHGDVSVALARDCREHGREFAEAVSQVLAGNGVRVFDLGVRPTPMLSFAVRELGCTAGVVITASHNTRDWNGYKVYDSEGCQATVGACRAIAESIRRVTHVRACDAEAQPAPDGLGRRYVQALTESAPAGCARGLRVAYSPLNGTGWDIVPGVLRADGAQVVVVPEQATLDGTFPTCPYPNPEDDDAMAALARLAQREGCDLALATDPDADRVGVLARHGGQMVRLSGDEVGELLLDWSCRVLEERGVDVAGRTVVSTVVSSAALDAICERWGLRLLRTLTGFKYIGEQVCRLEAEGRERDFLLGIEESLGYLSGTYVRDKDGIQGCLIVARMAAWHLGRGRDLVDALEGLRDEVGWYAKSQVSERLDARVESSACMRGVKAADMGPDAGREVVARRDFRLGARMPGDPSQTLPPSNVLQWDFADGCRLVVRPSGTEPKMKAYCFARGSDERGARSRLARLEEIARHLLRQGRRGRDATRLMGMGMDSLSMDEALCEVEALVLEGSGSYAIVADVGHVVRLGEDEELRRAFESASLVLAGGMPLVWASRLCKAPIRERIAGPDLLARVCEVAARKGYALCLLGAAVEDAAEGLRARFPGLRVAGALSAPRGLKDDGPEAARVVAWVRSLRPDILVVGLGTPEQERFIYRHRGELGVPLTLGLGACLDGAAADGGRARTRGRPQGPRRRGRERMRAMGRRLADGLRMVPLVVKYRRAGQAKGWEHESSGCGQ